MIHDNNDNQESIVEAIHAAICEWPIEACRDPFDIGGDCVNAAAAVGKVVEGWSIGEPYTPGGDLLGVQHHECNGESAVGYFNRSLSDLLRTIATHNCNADFPNV